LWWAERVQDGRVKPAVFAYHDPRTTAEVLDVLGEFGDDAALLSGGQSLMPMMNLRLAQPGHVIDLNQVNELAYIREDGDVVAFGAMTRHATAERSADVARALPLLAQAIPNIAFPSIRARGTIGGSIAHADPNAELACAAVALEATIVLASARGRREVPAESFFKGAYTTDRASDELLVEVRFPITPGLSCDFGEYARKQGDFALVLVGVVLDIAGSTCRKARVALGGVGPTAMRARKAEAALEGREVEDSVLAEAAALAAAEADPGSDIHASAAYRRRLVEVEVRRALTRALGKVR
jgi:carbon-monoxide dehydrogenase medium subunit